MKTTSLYLVLMLGLLCSFISFGTTAAAPTGAQAVDEAWKKAITANDLDRIMAVYSEDTVMWLPDAREARGREAIRKSYAAMLTANTVTTTLSTSALVEARGGLVHRTIVSTDPRFDGVRSRGIGG